MRTSYLRPLLGIGLTFALVCGIAIGDSAGISIDVWPEGKMPCKGAREPEANARPEKTDASRMP